MELWIELQELLVDLKEWHHAMDMQARNADSSVNEYYAGKADAYRYAVSRLEAIKKKVKNEKQIG